MHHVNSEPSLRICVQGFGGNSPCEGLGSFGSQVTQFQHRVDYVIQGFSGRSEYTFDDDVQVTDVGNGTDDALWASAAGSIGYVRSGADVGGNTGIFSKAAENNLAGLIFVNKDANCGQIEANDCVPIFKGSRIDEVAAANGGSIPSELPFIAMSKDAGEILEQSIFNATGPQGVLEMVIDVSTTKNAPSTCLAVRFVENPPKWSSLAATTTPSTTARAPWTTPREPPASWKSLAN